MKTSIEFWNRIADKYAARPISDQLAYDYTIERTLMVLKPTDSVLELGCGTGTTAFKIAPHVARYCATDGADNMLKIARDRAQTMDHANLSFAQRTVPAPRPDDTQYDAVIAFNFMHLIPDQMTALQDILAHLKPGGVFVSKTLCRSIGPKSLIFHAIKPALSLAHKFGQVPNPHFRTVRAWDDTIRSVGFEIYETGNYPLSPPRRFVIARKPR